MVNDYYTHPSGTTCREFIRWVTVFSWQFSLNRLPGHQRVLGPTNSSRRDGWPTRSYYDWVRTNQTDPPSPVDSTISLFHSPGSFSIPVLDPSHNCTPLFGHPCRGFSTAYVLYNTNPSPLCPQLVYTFDITP